MFAENLFTRISNEPVFKVGKNGKRIQIRDSGAPKSNAEAAALKKRVLELHRDKHNSWQAKYLRDKNDPDALADWEATTLDIFGYLPTKKYSKQIFRAKTTTKNKGWR